MKKNRRTTGAGAKDDIGEMKAQFRREDAALRAEGRGDEIIARNRRLLGIRPGAKGKLAGVGGKLFEKPN